MGLWCFIGGVNGWNRSTCLVGLAQTTVVPSDSNWSNHIMEFKVNCVTEVSFLVYVLTMLTDHSILKHSMYYVLQNFALYPTINVVFIWPGFRIRRVIREVNVVEIRLGLISSGNRVLSSGIREFNVVEIDNRVLSSNHNSAEDKPTGHAFQVWVGGCWQQAGQGDEVGEVEEEEETMKRKSRRSWMRMIWNQIPLRE